MGKDEGENGKTRSRIGAAEFSCARRCDRVLCSGRGRKVAQYGIRERAVAGGEAGRVQRYPFVIFVG